jgi:hypothetical protein
VSIGFEILWLIVCIIGFSLAMQRNRRRKIARAQEEYEARSRIRDTQSSTSEGYPAQPWGAMQDNDNPKQPGNDPPTHS